jgi:ABC-2 type transport system ATP-binding protein
VDVLVADRLTRRFGDVVAVDDVSLTVREGEVFGLLGPNGAGKTTTLRMIAGLIGATSGTVRVAGVDVHDPASAKAARALVGVLPEEVGLYADLSVARTLDFFARLYRVPAEQRATRIEALLDRLGLWGRRDDAAATLSKGLKQRLALARALVHDPPVVLLDEPTANLDPEATTLVREVLVELKAAGRAVVVNTHRLEEAERVCDRVGVLAARLVAVGTPEELRTHGGATRLHVTLVTWEPAFERAVVEAGARLVRVEGSTAELVLDSGPAATPAVVDRLVRAGAAVLSVVPESETLEEAYLDLVRRHP